MSSTILALQGTLNVLLCVALIITGVSLRIIRKQFEAHTTWLTAHRDRLDAQADRMDALSKRIDTALQTQKRTGCSP